jgi:hypothetical protein
MKDALLKVTKALPNGAASVTTDAIDTEKLNAAGHQPGNIEFEVAAPALSSSMLTSGNTMTYKALFSAASNLSSPKTLTIGVQTGANPGSGAAADTFKFRLPSDALRFVGVQATNSAAGNASTVEMTVEAKTA